MKVAEYMSKNGGLTRRFIGVIGKAIPKGFFGDRVSTDATVQQTSILVEQEF